MLPRTVKIVPFSSMRQMNQLNFWAVSPIKESLYREKSLHSLTIVLLAEPSWPRSDWFQSSRPVNLSVGSKRSLQTLTWRLESDHICPSQRRNWGNWKRSLMWTRWDRSWRRSAADVASWSRRSTTCWDPGAWLTSPDAMGRLSLWL